MLSFFNRSLFLLIPENPHCKEANPNVEKESIFLILYPSFLFILFLAYLGKKWKMIGTPKGMK